MHLSLLIFMCFEAAVFVLDKKKATPIPSICKVISPHRNQSESSGHGENFVQIILFINYHYEILILFQCDKL